MLRYLLVLFCLTLGSAVATAQAQPGPETVTRAAADDTALVADFYPADEDSTTLILLRMLNSRRGP